jgi:hypothetical protein
MQLLGGSKRGAEQSASPPGIETEKPSPSTSITPLPEPPAPLNEVQPPVAKEGVTAQRPAQVETASADPLPPILNAGITPNAQPLISIMQASSKGDWDSVDSQTQALKQTASPVKGNRKLSRESDAEGLKEFRQNNFMAAIAAFERGVKADSSDVEVINNLGYAHLQADHLRDATRILTHVLLLAPDRSSAWGNLADALSRTDNQNAPRDALRLAIYFSGNRQRTVEFLGRAAEKHSVEKFRSLASNVLREVDAIPPRTGRQANAPVSAPVPNATREQPTNAAVSPPAPQKTIDQLFSEQSAHCASGLPGIFCREAVRLKLCAGQWSENPPPGKTLCKQVKNPVPE